MKEKKTVGECKKKKKNEATSFTFHMNTERVGCTPSFLKQH